MRPFFRLALASLVFSLLPGTARAADAPLVAFLGDSLTEGYGVTSGEAYPTLVTKALEKAGKPIEMFNGSISGSTSASAPQRMKRILKKNPKVVVLSLGSNDALRGLDTDAMQKQLGETIEMAKKEKVKVLLVAVKFSSPYGPRYAEKFQKAYVTLSKKYSVPLMPDLLQGVFGNASLFQNDGLHPNAKGHAIMARTIQPYLEKLL